MKTKLILIFSLILLASTSVQAMIKGNYDVIPGTTPPAEGSKDQVVMYEFFAFHCPHCLHFHHEIPELKEFFGDKLKIVSVPVGWMGEDPGRLLYIARQHGPAKEEAVKSMIFSFFHEKGLGQSLYSRSKLFYVAKFNGLADNFYSLMDDPEIKNAMQKGMDLSKRMGVEGTPTIVIEGSLKTGGNPNNLKVIINSLLKNPVR